MKGRCKNCGLSEQERKVVLNALRFYRDETTHTNDESCCAGLPSDSKEYKLLTNAINRFEYEGDEDKQTAFHEGKAPSKAPYKEKSASEPSNFTFNHKQSEIIRIMQEGAVNEYKQKVLDALLEHEECPNNDCCREVIKDLGLDKKVK